MARHEPWNLAEASAIVAARSHEKGAALPILHDLMARYGYVDKTIVPVLADALNLSRAEIHGTITFYHDFKDHPPGRRTIKVCRAEACQSRGAFAVADELKRELGIDWHGTTADGAITIEPVYCLGLCACAPAALLDEEPIGNLSVGTVDTLIAEARA